MYHLGQPPQHLEANGQVLAYITNYHPWSLKPNDHEMLDILTKPNYITSPATFSAYPIFPAGT